MAILLGNKTTQLAWALDEAEGLVEQAQQENGRLVKKTSIDKKERKGLEYFIVTIELQHAVVKDIIAQEAE